MNNPKTANRKLVILGNGFDLNLGMKSKFSDFAASKYGKEVLQQNRWKNPRPYWYNFEENGNRMYFCKSRVSRGRIREILQSKHKGSFW